MNKLIYNTYYYYLFIPRYLFESKYESKRKYKKIFWNYNIEVIITIISCHLDILILRKWDNLSSIIYLQLLI